MRSTSRIPVCGSADVNEAHIQLVEERCTGAALRFRYDDDRVVEAPSIRRTRMNMVGRRTLELSEH
ncbi:MAG: hypothetical protein WCE62_11525 [Polyangiales bacterium]